MSKKIRVAIYVRVSTVHQLDKDSLPMQRQDLINYAKVILGTDDYVIFEDAGYSGKNTDRPRFQEMMVQMRQGVFSHLLVWKLDRISRNLLDFAAMYAELKHLGVTFISKNEQFDTSSAMGEAMLKIVLVFAELERNMTSERVRATMISRASNGLWNGGRIPFGYNWEHESKTITVNDSEAPLVQLIHNLYEDTRSLVRESRILNERGYSTRAGGSWNPVSLHIILNNIFYCGDYRYNVLKEGNRQHPKDKNEWVTVENHHPAIISREQKERIIGILESNSRLAGKRNTYKSGKYTHIFSGLLFCGNCGKPMGASPASAKKDWQYSKYSCYTRRSSNGCIGKWVSDPLIGEFVFNYILNMLNAQSAFSPSWSPADLEHALLLGDTFSYISSIGSDGLNDMYNMLSSGKITDKIYGKGTSVCIKHEHKESELTHLRAEKQKIERAIERLTSLYLYSEASMSESEFVIQKSTLTNKLDEINAAIGFTNADDWEQSVSDDIFIQRASEFLIAQKLSGRKYINYKRLAMSVDHTVLQTFLRSIIDSIVIDCGYIKQIIFKNGLTHIFIF